MAAGAPDPRRSRVPLGALLASGQPPAHGTQPCPEAHLLALAARGGLSAEERPMVHAHLAGCNDCRDIVSALLVSADMPSPVAAPAWHRWSFVAAAACVLIAVFSLRSWMTGDSEDGGPGGATLVASFDQLRAAHPALFKDLSPLNEAELRGLHPEVVRSAATLACGLPREMVFDPSPTFWFTSPEAGLHVVECSDTNGVVVWRESVVVEREGDAPQELAYPAGVGPLRGGEAYVWTVTLPNQGNRPAASAAFRVADSVENRRRSETLAAIDAGVRGVQAAAVKAQAALERSWLSDALEHARLWATSAPDDPLAVATLRAATLRARLPEPRAPH